MIQGGKTITVNEFDQQIQLMLWGISFDDISDDNAENCQKVAQKV